jgi:DNA helicase-2/ATP-dependent DNA helicase PcrA
MSPQLQEAMARLNGAQREAVLHENGPLLILAGAGSGKTRVITVRIAHLLEHLHVDPRSILAVTFTNKAAGEMRERAIELVEPARDVTIRTFHSFGAWMLRRNATAAGLPSGFTIYDDDDVVTLLHTLYPEHKRNILGRYAHGISRAKDYCLTPEDDLSAISSDPDLPAMYRRYQTRLEEIGNVDFGDLIMRPVQLLQRDPVVAQRLRSRFRYILVDEYQDSNVAQYQLLRHLSDGNTQVCVVGDDDQSIYRFRGAEVRNILSFPEIFPNTRVVRLEQNYRSTAPILSVAGAVVAQNTDRLGKELFTERPGGEKPRLVLLPDQDDEVAWVVTRVRKAVEDNEPGETAILYRTNAQSRAFETAFLREGIPYRIVGSLRFYEREEIRDAVAFLRLLANPRDEISFRRVVNKPPRGIGPKAIATILQEISSTEGDLLQALSRASSNLSRKAAREGTQFLGVFSSLDTILASSQSEHLGMLLTELLELSGLVRFHEEQDEVTGTQKLQNLEELVNAASLYRATREGLVEFLEAIELDSARRDSDDSEARVVLITMHNTKGLEFDRVIITGLEEGLFPRNEDPQEIEEERRLFYVAVTRAQDELTITSCRSRRIHGRFMDLLPSRFLGEIPEDLLVMENNTYGRIPGLSTRRNDGDAEHPFPRGTGVYHDDYGSGVVVRAWYAGREACVLVQFETGMSAQFFPAYTPLERIETGDEGELEW